MLLPQFVFCVCLLLTVCAHAQQHEQHGFEHCKNCFCPEPEYAKVRVNCIANRECSVDVSSELITLVTGIHGYDKIAIVIYRSTSSVQETAQPAKDESQNMRKNFFADNWEHAAEEAGRGFQFTMPEEDNKLHNCPKESNRDAIHSSSTSNDNSMYTEQTCKQGL